MKYDYPSLLKRLIAIIYDSLLLFGVLFFAALIPSLISGGPIKHPLFSLYLYLVAFLFFGWFWTHGGQTLGMKAWRLRVINEDGSPIGWGKAFVRYLVASISWLILGLGFLWALFDPKKQTLHDHLTRSLLIQKPKEP
jgi:uncharacterized RDD family membrane protein YckC